MPGSLLRDFAVGWVAGQAVGTLVARRADRRGLRVDRDDIIEKWALLGGTLAMGLGAFVKLF
jgi:hypothetical protein